jgi:hypothetical protein
VDEEVVRAKRFELVDNEGNTVASIGMDWETLSGGLTMRVEREGERIYAVIGLQDGEPLLGFTVSTADQQSLYAGIGIVNGTPTLLLSDAEGNS